MWKNKINKKPTYLEDCGSGSGIEQVSKKFLKHNKITLK